MTTQTRFDFQPDSPFVDRDEAAPAKVTPAYPIDAGGKAQRELLRALSAKVRYLEQQISGLAPLDDFDVYSSLLDIDDVLQEACDFFNDADPPHTAAADEKLTAYPCDAPQTVRDHGAHYCRACELRESNDLADMELQNMIQDAESWRELWQEWRQEGQRR
jgi:hypothetical protein